MQANTLFDPLATISFDEQDANLFAVEDARLRADALRHSLQPRLRTVMHRAIALIREIYGIEALDESLVSMYPNFRQNRKNELHLLYDSAFIGLGGKRKAQWSGFARCTGKPVQILPFRFALYLTAEGMRILLENGWLTGLTPQSYESLLRFHLDHEHAITPLCFQAQMRPEIGWAENLSLLAPLQAQYQYRIKHQLYDNHFVGRLYPFPISSQHLQQLIFEYACFFPVYDAYLQIAKQAPFRMDTLITQLSSFLQELDSKEEIATGPSEADTETINSEASRAAAARVRIMPAIRWQVFQRDQWKCVACGRSSHDGAILHMDHILPRSRGGADSLDNLQTLCDVCNMGKGNRDDTNLRRKG